ncbi:DUF5821 family protein [Halorubrum saccharovorum]|uniref:transcriptional regulator TbsP domain-containing protein n=1 Tax=Halorubrum saccharovorum TaxID=2248 RepID=UPI002679CA9E
MAPSTGDDDTSKPEADAPSEVAVALDEADDRLADAVESALTGRPDVVAVGVPLALLPPILAARSETTGGTWRVACRPGVADALGRALVLGTGVAEAVAKGAIELRTVTDQPDAQRMLFASSDRVDAVAALEGNRTLVSAETPERVAPAARAVRERFASATPATVDMPREAACSRPRLETLDDRFADDVAATLDALPYGAVGRTGEVTDRTLLVALAARHDHLLWDLRRWIGGGADGENAEGVGIAAGQDLTGDRRALVRRGLIEAIKVPAGDGRPPTPASRRRRRAAPRDPRRGAQRAPRAVRAPGRRGRPGSRAPRTRRAATGVGTGAT